MTVAPRARIGRPPETERPPGYTRQRLLDSAAAVFAARGFENGSLEVIAQGAGVTSATVYRHFRNKLDLLLAVVEQAIEAVPIAYRLARSDSLSATDVSDLVAAYGEPGLVTLRKLSIELHAVAGRRAGTETMWLDFNRRVHRGVERQLATAVEKGEVRADLDTAHAASLLLVVLLGLCHLDTLEPDLIGDRRWSDFLARTVVELLQPPEEQRGAPPGT